MKDGIRIRSKSESEERKKAIDEQTIHSSRAKQARRQREAKSIDNDGQERLDGNNKAREWRSRSSM
jgi:hypothetical protein